MTLGADGFPIFTDYEREEVTRLMVLRDQLRSECMDRAATMVFLVPTPFLVGVVAIYGVPLRRLPILEPMVGLEPPRPKPTVSGRVLSRHERGPRPGFDDQRASDHDDD